MKSKTKPDNPSDINFNYLKHLFMLLPFLYGLFYEWSSCLAGILFVIYILVTYVKNKELKIYYNLNLILLVLLGLMYVIVCFYAIDYGMALTGIVKFLPIVLFAIITMQLSADRKRELLMTVTRSASVMTVLSVSAYVTPLRNYFFHAGRLGGFFQYSNTFALFLLIALIILFEKEPEQKVMTHKAANHKKDRKRKIVSAVISGFGIIITGSRSVLVFSIVSLLIYAVYKIKNRRQNQLANSYVKKEKQRTEYTATDTSSGGYNQNIVMLVMTVTAIIAAGILFAVLSDNTYTLTRYKNISLRSSTFVGRMLYYQDAIHMIRKHPMGLGYLGYRYICGSEQTGVYFVKYVHNDFLQTGLDIGIAGMVILTILFLKNVMSKHCTGLQKIIFIMVTLHSLFDFDLQYLFMDLILILCMDMEPADSLVSRLRVKHSIRSANKTDSEITDSRNKKEWHSAPKELSIGISVALLILFCYMFIPLILEHFAKHSEAAALYPYYTEAKVNKMLSEKDMNQQFKMAEEIIQQNRYCSNAYYVSAICAVNHKDYELMQKRQYRLLQLEKYDLYNYKQYIRMLSYALEDSINASDDEKVREYAEYVIKVPDMLEKVKAETSDLAYKISVKPQLELSSTYLTYIATIADYLEENNHMTE